MASRRSSKSMDPPAPKDWTLAALNRGIEKLKLRLQDLEELASTATVHSDPRVSPLESEIAATIEDVFGEGSREATEHSYIRISKSGNVQMARFREAPQITERREREYFALGVSEVREILLGLIKRLHEKQGDFRKCPKCGWTFRNEDYCTEDGSHLMALDYNPDAPTLTGDR